MKRESNFTPTARGDGGRAHGLFQHHADRRAAILRATGIDMSSASFEKQLEGAWWEMNSGDAGAQRALRALKAPGITARQAGAAFVQNFERPARDERASRGALAEGMLRQFGGGGNAGAGLADAGSGDVFARLQRLKSSGLVSGDECTQLAKAAVGAHGSVRDWRKGANAADGTLKPGTPVATFLNRDGSQSSRYAGGGTGTPGAGLDHAAVFQAYVRDKAGKAIGMSVAEQYRRSGGVRERTYMFGQGRGERNGSNYSVVLGPDGRPLGGDRNPMNGAPIYAASRGPRQAGENDRGFTSSGWQRVSPQNTGRDAVAKPQQQQTTNIHVHSHIDGRKVASSVTQHQFNRMNGPGRGANFADRGRLYPQAA